MHIALVLTILYFLSLFQPLICERIVNGTVVEEEEEENKETEEEEVEELDQIANQQQQFNRFESQQTNRFKNQYGTNNQYGSITNQYGSNYNQYGKRLSNQMSDVKKRRFGSDNDNEEESVDDEEEPKADVNIFLSLYNCTFGKFECRQFQKVLKI